MTAFIFRSGGSMISFAISINKMSSQYSHFVLHKTLRLLAKLLYAVMIDYQATWASNKMHFVWAFKTRVRVSRVSKNNWLPSVLRSAEYYEKLPTVSQGIVPLTTGGYVECVLWEFRQPNTHSEPINKPLVDEIMDFPDIIYQNNNYVENLHATDNNKNKNIILVQQLYIPKHSLFFKDTLFHIRNLGVISKHNPIVLSCTMNSELPNDCLQLQPSAR